MLNYYEDTESDNYEDYKKTWEDADDTEFKKEQAIKVYIHKV